MAFSASTIFLCIASLIVLLASPSCAIDSLNSDEYLFTGQFLKQGPYILLMQTDGNLVLYENNKVLWSTKTNGRGPGCYLTLQRDGNLVIHQGDLVIWSSNTGRSIGSYVLMLKIDGNLVIYAKPEMTAIAATGTNKPGSPGAPSDRQIGTVGK